MNTPLQPTPPVQPDLFTEDGEPLLEQDPQYEQWVAQQEELWENRCF